MFAPMAPKTLGSWYLHVDKTPHGEVLKRKRERERAFCMSLTLPLPQIAFWYEKEKREDGKKGSYPSVALQLYSSRPHQKRDEGGRPAL